MEPLLKVRARENQLSGLKQGDKMPVTQINGEREKDTHRREVNSRIGDLAGTGRAKVDAVNTYPWSQPPLRLATSRTCAGWTWSR